MRPFSIRTVDEQPGQTYPVIVAPNTPSKTELAGPDIPVSSVSHLLHSTVPHGPDYLMLPRRSEPRSGAAMYDSEIFVCFNRAEHIPVTVMASGRETPLQQNTTHLLRGNLIPHRYSRSTLLVVTSSQPADPAPLTDRHLLPRTYISSNGTVTERYFLHGDQRWIVIALHRDYDPTSHSIVSFDVEYTLQRGTMQEIGRELFRIGDTLGLHVERSRTNATVGIGATRLNGPEYLFGRYVDHANAVSQTAQLRPKPGTGGLINEWEAFSVEHYYPDVGNLGHRYAPALLVLVRCEDAHFIPSTMIHWLRTVHDTIEAECQKHVSPLQYQPIVHQSSVETLLHTCLLQFLRVRDPRMAVNFSGVFRLKEEVSVRRPAYSAVCLLITPDAFQDPGLLQTTFPPCWFRCSIYLPLIGRWNREVFVHVGQAANSSAATHSVWLTGEVLARTQLRDTMIRVSPGFAFEQGAYASQLPAPAPIITVHSRGHVISFSQRNFDCWIIVALHNVTEESLTRLKLAQVTHFNMVYEASNALVAQIGPSVFRPGNVVNFHGVVMHYVCQSGKWIIKTCRYTRKKHAGILSRPGIC
ncbi:uncharacterized protein MELLADRAFT_107968 [Melampsora larici-populina 98AG31]|uniref:Uncharacterized protein n=1 Tax=Melampsora larici-populina (strain 98AG31 / pathotype 3-4-7) TaxID=747676 RepID=F4RRJ5_MELLP|nr:uncharacterized protein MELLADRAFT_107968 [Melampsora larici-populina 98AG31]EGG05015.1 hypothetical protein MELLADRAFT_107968 [Melampsora larici-populina 98AG31]